MSEMLSGRPSEEEIRGARISADQLPDGHWLKVLFKLAEFQHVQGTADEGKYVDSLKALAGHGLVADKAELERAQQCISAMRQREEASGVTDFEGFDVMQKVVAKFQEIVEHQEQA